MLQVVIQKIMYMEIYGSKEMATNKLSLNIIHKAILRCSSNLKGNEYYLQQKGIARLLPNCFFHTLQQQWTELSQKTAFFWIWTNRFFFSIP